MTVSIQGNKGSYSHIAAAHMFGSDIELLERNTFPEVFEDLISKRVDYIVVPIENSTHGSVYQNYDNLSAYECEIVGELYLKINFHLIVHPGTKLEDITELYSHPVAINQIKKFSGEHPNITVKEYHDTAGSVEMIKKDSKLTAAAAASRFAAELYGMEVLEENIHENPKNYTRFYVIERKHNAVNVPKSLSGIDNKTTIQFSLGAEAGSLYKTLRSFADRDIALTKIESRPVINTDWEYRFYVDILAGMKEEKLAHALKEVEQYVKELRVLGSYVQGEYVTT